MTKEKLITRDFITVTTINFLLYLVFYLLMVIMAAYSISTFNTSASTAGLVSGIFIIGILFGRLGAGRIIETAGSKKILIIGAAFYLATSLGYFAAANLALLISIRFLHGMAYGVASTATGTIVAQIIPHSRRGEGIGYYSLSQILAAALGPFLGIFLYRQTGFNVILLLAAGIAAINLVISFSIKNQPGKAASPDQGDTAAGRFIISDYIEFRAIPISMIVLIVGFAYSVILSFLSLYAQEIHLEKAAGFFFLVYAATVLVSRPFSGRILDAKGSNFVVYPCLLLFSMGMLLLSQADHWIALLAASSVIGLGYGNFLSCGQAISIKDVPTHRLGLATATYYIFLDLGFGIGPYVFGYLIPIAGYRGLYAIMAGMLLLTIGLYYFLFSKKQSTSSSKR